MKSKAHKRFRVVAAVVSGAILAGVLVTAGFRVDRGDRVVHVFSAYVGEDSIHGRTSLTHTFPSIVMIRTYPMFGFKVDNSALQCQFDCQDYSIELHKENIKVGEVPLNAWEMRNELFDVDGRQIGVFSLYLEGHMVNPPEYTSYVLRKNGEEITYVEKKYNIPPAISISGLPEKQYHVSGTPEYAVDGPIRFALSVRNNSDLNWEYQFFWRYENDSVDGLSYGKFPRSAAGIIAPSGSSRTKIEIDLAGMIPRTDWAQVSVAVYSGPHTQFTESRVFTVK